MDIEEIMQSAYFLKQARRALDGIDRNAIDEMVLELRAIRERGGRLFLAGSGGGAGHASHAACDFRKLCDIEAYCCSDNVSELTARINDEGWENSISGYLKASRIKPEDGLMIFSVGGGSETEGISLNLVQAIKAARGVGASVLGVVGRDGGYTLQEATACVVVPTIDSNLVTALTESFQALVWHLMISHPLLQVAPTKWESTSEFAEVNDTPWPLKKTKVFADTADLNQARELLALEYIAGLTTNPTLMRAAGVSDYWSFASELVQLMGGRPVSLEVFSDEFDEMEQQARDLATLGKNVFVKIPITNTRAESSVPLIRKLVADGVQINVTAIMTLAQIEGVLPAVVGGPRAYLSVFAGRIADAGVDPLGLMEEVVNRVSPYPEVEIIWASPRELFNLVQADRMGCHVITVTQPLLKQIPRLGTDLSEFSLNTVKMFRDDALACGYQIKRPD